MTFEAQTSFTSNRTSDALTNCQKLNPSPQGKFNTHAQLDAGLSRTQIIHDESKTDGAHHTTDQ